MAWIENLDFFPDYERSLKRDLHRTRALLRDAQSILEKQRDPATSRNVIKQLRNQVNMSLRE